MGLLRKICFISILCAIINLSTAMPVKGLYHNIEHHSKINHILTKRSNGLYDWWKHAKIKTRCFVSRVFPGRIQNFFAGKNSEGTNYVAEVDPCNEEDERRKEHGTLDSIGRDLVRNVGKTIEKVGEGVGRTIQHVQNRVNSSINHVTRKIGISVDVSNMSAGLDSNRTFYSGVVDKFKEHVQAIVPGTKWCGDGNRSTTYHDLGTFARTDACCREHDLCPINIPAGETKFGLINTGLFSRSECTCDTKFYKCLKSTNDLISKQVGFTYFTVLGPQCFRQDYPIKGCIKNVSGKCVEYDYDVTSNIKYQWFDNPKF